jgi:hypothetical protein
MIICAYTHDRRLCDSRKAGYCFMGVGQSEFCAMTRKEIAVEFIIPTMFAVAVGLCGLAAVAFVG